jgi:hypothetical protein
MRGIVEGNGNPPGNDMWLTYSMNKEDMWISRMPLPIRFKVDGNVKDNFDNLEIGGAVTDWNIYAPKWAPVEVTEYQDTKNKTLLLKDKDPYDYARAIRVFKETTNAEISFSMLSGQADKGLMDIDITDQFGNRPVRISFNEDGRIIAINGSKEVVLQKYQQDKWYKFRIKIDAIPFGHFSISIDGIEVLKEAQLAVAVKSVERVSFRTGPYRNLPNRNTPNQDPAEPLEGADVPLQAVLYYIDDVNITSK